MLHQDVSWVNLDNMTWIKMFVAYKQLCHLEPGERFDRLRVCGISKITRSLIELHEWLEFWTRWMIDRLITGFVAYQRLRHLEPDERLTDWRKTWILKKAEPNIHVSESSLHNQSLDVKKILIQPPFYMLFCTSMWREIGWHFLDSISQLLPFM